MNGANFISLATLLNRKMELCILNRFEFVVQFSAIATRVTCAYFQGTIWALVGEGLFSKIFKLTGSYLLKLNLLRHFVFLKKSIKELVFFVVGSSFMRQYFCWIAKLINSFYENYCL
ncbi:oligosaccharide flippase family protein [cyanobacterium endosymbiont of Rhopalodia gibberula]|uniref:oligosaccharide flippase family protein n=1 Tax=cyanobacterium endosymbiont of Rhopalodia gibberula TaxID=1763363 RepID=UPI003B830F06